MTARDRTEHALRRAHRVLLRAYPASFRALFGEDVEETFVDRLRDARRTGAGATARYVAVAALDAIASGARERLTTRPTSRMLYWQDVRYALRLLARSPLFTLLTLVVLGGGLALGIFTFSFLYSASLRPLPLADGARIVRVTQVARGSGGAFDAADLAAMRPAIRTLTDVGVYTPRQLVVGDEGRPRVVQAVAAEWNIFEMTRTPPAFGRAFRPGDQQPGAEPVIVLGHRTWEVAFGGDSSVVGRVLPIDGVATRVVGVMPTGYGFPVAAESWVPVAPEALATPPADRYALDVFARLAPGVDASAARRELATLLARARRERPAPAAGATVVDAAPTGVAVESFPMAQLGEEGPLALAVLNLLAALILLLACINVTNLLLARANERARETAVRLALGASRGRLAMQSLWESVLLCLGGGVLGTALAAWALRAIDGWAHARLEGNLAFWWVWRLDGTTLVAAGAFVTLTFAVLGGAVAARATSARFHAVLRDGGARSGGRREGRVTRTLVAAQVATVSVLLFFGVMSGIVAHRVATLDLGYDTRNLLTTTIAPPGDRYDTRAKRGGLYETLADALAGSPAVDGVVLRAGLADMASDAAALEIGDVPTAPGAVRPRAYVQGTLGSLATLGVALHEGRLLDARDRDDAVPTAVVSAAFAARHWPGASAIGRRIRLSGLGEGDRPRTVVGVVSDVLLGNPMSRDRSALAVYVPLGQADAAGASLVVRHRGDAAAAQAALFRAAAAIDPLVVPASVTTFAEMLGKTALIARSVTKLFALCFGFALLLAVTGTYGLMARAIGRRTREIGVRRALGAPDAVIVRSLLGQGGRQLGVGALVALPLMLVVGVGFAHFFPLGVALTVAIGVGVCTAIVGVVLAATWVPTRKAMAIAPSVALWRD